MSQGCRRPGQDTGLGSAPSVTVASELTPFRLYVEPHGLAGGPGDADAVELVDVRGPDAVDRGDDVALPQPRRLGRSARLDRDDEQAGLLRDAGSAPARMPRAACVTEPLAMSWSAMRIAESTGMAKPIPMLPPLRRPGTRRAGRGDADEPCRAVDEGAAAVARD